MTAAPGARATLDAFEAAVRRESHVLARRPDLLSQQLHNRLQWTAAGGLLDSPTGAGAPRPWMRTRTPYRESGALVMTLQLVDRRGGVLGERVLDCAFGPDGRFLVCIGGRGQFQMWDPVAGRLLRDLEPLEGRASCCAVSSDGRFAVVGGYRPDLPIDAPGGGALQMVDLRTGDRIRSLPGHDKEVRDCAVSPDAAWILTASQDKTLRVWRASDGECVAILRGHEDTVSACAWMPDGSRVVSVGHDGTLKVWELPPGECVATLPGALNGCAVSPDGARVVSATGDDAVRIWDPGSGDVVATIEGAGTPLAFTPDGSHLITTARNAELGQDVVLEVRAFPSLEARGVLRGHARRMHSCEVSPDGGLVASSDDEGAVKIWDLAAAEPETAAGHNYRATSCAMSPDGSFFVSTAIDARVWDPETGALVRTLDGHRNLVTSCGVTPDSRVIVTASRDRMVRLFDAASGRNLLTTPRHWQIVTACAVAPDASWVASVCGDQTAIEEVRVFELRFIDAATAEEIRMIPAHRDTVVACRPTPDGGRLVTASSDRTLNVWDVRTGECTRTIEDERGFDAMDVSPDGRLAVTGGSVVKVWDLESGSPVRALDDRSWGGGGCAFSPDGAHVATFGREGDLQLWDLSAGELVASLPLLGTGRCVAMHPWKPLAACADVGGNVYFVDLVGVEYGPIVVTPRMAGDARLARCPRCGTDVEAGGGTLECPSCGLALRPNPFVLELVRPLPG